MKLDLMTGYLMNWQTDNQSVEEQAMGHHRNQQLDF